jgi:hypothetical protein
MSGFKRKPLQTADELTEALRDHAGSLPAVTGGITESSYGRAGQEARPKPRKTVQVNFNCTEEMARLIAQLATESGSTRRMLARLLRDAGHSVPEADLNPLDNRRRWMD